MIQGTNALYARLRQFSADEHGRFGRRRHQDALSQWLHMNHGRHVLTLADWLAALEGILLVREALYND